VVQEHPEVAHTLACVLDQRDGLVAVSRGLHAPGALGSNVVLRAVGVLRNIVVLRSMRTIGRVSYACQCNRRM
jgi:hypothetical protein